MTLNELIVQLETGIEALPLPKRVDAQDLCDKARRFKSASANQIKYMVALLKLSRGEQPERETVPVGDMAGVIALFDSAKAHLKAPAIVVAYKEEEETRFLRLKPSLGHQGAINVTAEPSRDWLGRIDAQGGFERNRRMASEAERIVPVLQRFAADPVTGAKESARLTGKCVFCNTKLKDERSTNVGYGKTCAGRYGLAWG